MRLRNFALRTSCILLTNFINLQSYPVPKILRHFDGWADFPFTTSEKKLVYTTSLRVALISLLLKIKEIKNYQENIILP